jgi:predicted DCC family thiol-disulfide oxidoreductase YuxK
MKSGTKTVYFDGECPMCQAFQSSVTSSKQSAKFTFVDVNTGSLPAGVSKGSALQEMHVVDDHGAVFKSANSVLAVLDEYHNLRWLAVIGRSPFINSILMIGYRWTAKNRYFLFGSAARLWWLKLLVVVGFLSAIAISLPLWWGQRVFPKIPMFDAVAPVVSSMEGVLLLGLVVALITSAIYNKPRRYLLAAVGIVGIFILGDQMRFQPWVYQYSAMLLVLASVSWERVSISSYEVALHALRLMVAAIYFYSGLQKLNLQFITTVFPWMSEPIVLLLPESMALVPFVFGVFVPFIEMAIGIGLLTKQFRTWALLGTIGMLVLVMFSLGPFGHNWNHVVWPWNVVIAASAWILFWRTNKCSLRDIVWVKNSLVHKLVIIFFCALPALSFINLWDSYPSFSLYSGTTAKFHIELKRDALLSLPPIAKEYVVYDFNEVRLDYYSWSFDELRVPVYPEVRVYRKVAAQLCATNDHPDSLLFTVYDRLVLYNRAPDQQFTCADL